MTVRLASLALAGVLTAAFAAPACAASAKQSVTPQVVKSKTLSGAYLSARHAEANADNEGATQFFNRALQLDPENQELLRQAFFLAAQVGDFDTAIPAAQKSYDGSQQLSMAPLILAVAHFKKGEYDQTNALLRKISGQSPVGFSLPMLRAWALAPKESVDKALGELAPLQGPKGAIDLYNVMAGMLNEHYGRGAEALANYEPVAGHIENQALSMVRLVTAGYMRQGKVAEAKALVAKYRAARGGSPMTDDYLDAFVDPQRVAKKVTAQDGMAEALFASSQILLQAANTAFSAQLAVVYGQSALYLNPEMSFVRRIIGITLAGANRFEESNAMLATIKKTEPGYLAVQMQMAENLERLEKPAEALVMLQAIAKEKADWPDAQVAIGDHYRREKKFAEAVDAYDKAFKLWPKGESNSWQAYYARGIALERIKQFDRADKDFRKAIALNGEDAGLLNYLGYSLIERGVNVQEGRALIEKAYKLRPGDGYITDSLGWAMYLMGETEGAVKNLEKAVESTPADPTINEHLGDAYWKIGRRQEAMFQWRRALSLDPDDTQRSALQKKVAQGLASNEAQQPR